ncbi:MAG TPA: PqqD family peptide modification chaperone [Thiotrichaceae bacterium]|nr:PqqD family peptide modification chaperone [Thiotrichaceae bacterium]
MNILTTSNITEHLFEDHLVLLNHATNQLLLLNPSAQLVWQWFAQGHSDQQVIDKLADFFNIPRATAEQDVKKLCDNWYQHKLLIDSVESETPLMPEDDNAAIVSTPAQFDTQSLNTYKCYLLANRPFSLRFNEQNALANQIHSLFAHIEVPDQQPLKNFSLIHKKKHHILLADGELLFHDPVFENVKGYLVHEILKLSYPNTQWLAMIHAMAVAYGEKAVVMPAPSGYGKSTLTAALLKEGFSYLGDDLVPIQRGTHHITPLLARLSIKKGSWQLLDTHYPELNTLPVYNSRERHIRYLNPSRYMKTNARLPVSALVFPHYQAGQSATLKPISAIESLQRLIQNEIWLGNPLENDIVSEFLTWLSAMPSFSFEYSELDQAVQKIQGLFSDCL